VCGVCGTVAMEKKVEEREFLNFCRADLEFNFFMFDAGFFMNFNFFRRIKINNNNKNITILKKVKFFKIKKKPLKINKFQKFRKMNLKKFNLKFSEQKIPIASHTPQNNHFFLKPTQTLPSKKINPQIHNRAL
jgi:hypothetical protein